MIGLANKFPLDQKNTLWIACFVAKNTASTLLLIIRKFNFLLPFIKKYICYNFIYLSRIGVGEKTETMATKTKGEAPAVPVARSFLEVSAGSVTLHLNAWKDGGCAILYFVVEYKPR